MVIYKNLPFISYVLVLEADVLLPVDYGGALEPVVGEESSLTNVEEVRPHDDV